MKTRLQTHRLWARRLHSSPHRQLFTALPVEAAEPSPAGYTDILAFQQKAFIPKKPFIFRGDTGSTPSFPPASQLPAAQKWFDSAPSGSFSTYMNEFCDWPFPYELVKPELNSRESLVARFRDWLMTSQSITDQILAGILQSTLAESGRQTFHQLYAPLQLLIKALEFNKTQLSDSSDTLQLYIAQSSLSDLPPPLQQDLPTPELVRQAGKGDVYSSSIWLGTEPTYTPLHRDPNPNLFCQLHSRKVVRLLPPALGDRLFFEVQVKIRQQGNSRIRTADMMQGEEREALHEAVWENESLPEEVYEADVGAGDALFIPDGWWHSVKSLESGGQLNGSVNWWFR